MQGFSSSLNAAYAMFQPDVVILKSKSKYWLIALFIVNVILTIKILKFLLWSGQVGILVDCLVDTKEKSGVKSKISVFR